MKTGGTRDTTKEGFFKDLLAVGKVLKPHGLNGTVRVRSYAESVDTLRQIRQILILRDDEAIPLDIASTGQIKGLVLLAFRGRVKIEDVKDLIGETLYVRKGDLKPLPEGEYYWHQLIGMEVRTAAGTHLGTIEHIIPTGANDVYVVREENREFLIPAIRDVIHDVDVERRSMTIHPLDGMLDENDL